MKGKNWKEMVIEHGEKGILGMVVCFVLVALGLTQWSTYSTPPSDFSDKVNKEEANFAASKWTDDEKKTYEGRDPGDQVARLLEGQPLTATYDYSTKWVWPLHKRRQKVKQPEYLAIQELVADGDSVLMGLTAAKAEGNLSGVDIVLAGDGETADAPPGTAATPAADDPEAPRGPRGPRGRTGNAPGAGAALLPGSATPASPGMSPPGGAYPGGGGSGSSYPGAGTMAGGDYMAEGYMGMGSSQKVTEAEGKYFAAIRGVIPMKSQVARFQQALNLDTTQEAAQLIQYWDFELERMQAQPGADPWSGEWEKVSLEFAVDIVSRMEFDIDVVDEQYRDSVFTMPLPYRLSGDWSRAAGRNGVLASHPQIKKLLTEKEQEEAELRAQAALKAAELAKAKEGALKRGFHGSQVDLRGLQGQMRGNAEMSKMYNDTMSDYMQEGMMGTGADPSAAMQSRQTYGYGGMNRLQAVATPDLLLFRFFDFSVVPGNAYRYRVRLQIRNPNFERDPSELLDASSREGEFHYTPWSNASSPAIIQESNELYVQKVDPRKETVAMDAYQWRTDSGTTVGGTIDGISRGEQIAEWTREVTRRGEQATEGGVSTRVLRPAAETYYTEQIDFVTPNVLVDFRQESLLNPDDHPDLQLSAKRVAGTLNEVTIVNRFGEIETINSNEQATAYNRMVTRMKKQEELWAFLPDSEKPAMQMSGIDNLLGGYPGAGEGNPAGYMQEPGMDMGSSRRRRSSLKRGRGQGGDYMNEGYNPYNQGGMMMPPGASGGYP